MAVCFAVGRERVMASFPCQAFPVQINLSTARAILLRGEDSAGSRRWTSHEITFAFLFEAILKLGANWSARSGAPLTTSPPPSSTPKKIGFRASVSG